MCDRTAEVLPLASRPIRYTGGEYNALFRDPDPGRVSWVLGMPEVYELGMSNHGLRILYSILNRLDSALCERCFVPWPDFGGLLKAQGIPLYALESKRPVREFDVIGLSLQTELSYTNVLYLLDLAGVPLHSDERTDKDPLVVAGGPCTVNPLPLSGYVDAFVVGDGEELVPEITAVVAGCRRDRGAVLSSLARLPGVYVPGLTPKQTGAVRRQVVAELREEDSPFPPVLPICEITHDRLAIEINRGCTRGCRFCQAGIINRPVRFRDVDQIVRLAERGIRATGWEEVSLLSLSALDYPDLENLVQRLTSILRPKRVSLSLPSTRGEDFSPELAFDLQEVKKAGLTFAPETASSRLRTLINKNIPEQTTLESIRAALDAGWHGVKLYFMVGLPTETDADVDEIARFVDEIARLCRGRSVRFSMSPFVPKPHTPLQWAGFAGIDENQARIDRLKSMLTRRNVKPKWESPASSFTQALLARGDEKLGPVIERVYRAGGVFQEWTEQFQLQTWLEACDAEGVDPQQYVGPRDPKDGLAWDLVDVGVNRDFLRSEYERAQQGKATSDCARAECSDCGVCANKTPPSRPRVSAPETIRYGRKSRLRDRPEDARTRFRLRYAVEQQYRFAGHLDRVRALYRSMRRSELPVLFTKGYSPKPMLSFGPPLPVGLVSDGEYFDVFASLRYSGNIVRDLGPFLPRGLRIGGARAVPRLWPTLGKCINRGRYLVRLPEAASGRLPEVLERGRELAGVRDLEPAGEDSLRLDLAIVPGVRLLSVLGRLLEIGDSEVRCLRVRRLDCLVETDGRIVTPMEDR
ncbi:MAG: TIGR03960 family B12-binding radical SAM protein [candidate division WOR-3 bacterium]|nr:MAG: TIGR03960 family B12-binding radical SAM protein [candidate division WOR-3 bacterium]